MDPIESRELTMAELDGVVGGLTALTAISVGFSLIRIIQWFRSRSH